MALGSLAGMLETSVAVVMTAALKGAVVVAIALLVAHLLRRRSAAARHAVWAIAILAHLVLVIASPLVPRVDVPIVPVISWGQEAGIRSAFRVTTESGVPASPVEAVVIKPAGSVNPAGNPAGNPGGSINATIIPANDMPGLPSPLTLLLAAWLAGAVLVFGRFLLGTARVARLARESERVADGTWLSLAQRMAAGMGIARPLTLVRGGQLDVPVTWGILYPVVFLPEDSGDWPEERRRFVLVHELAHVKRLDAVTQLLTQVAVALFWFDPFVWYAAARIRIERERACDDHVLLHGTRPSVYADELLAMVRGLARHGRDPAPAFAALAMARRSEFEGRMLAILDPIAARTSLSRRAGLMAFAAALLLLAPLAAVRPVAASERPSQEAESPVAAGSQSIPSLGAAAVVHVGTAAPVSSRPPAPAGNAGVSPSADLTTASVGSLAAVPQAFGTKYQCRQSDLAATGRQVSIHGHSDDNPASSYTESVMKTAGRCTYALLLGNVTLALDLTDVASLAAGGRAVFEELTSGGSRKLTITRAADGSLDRQYFENGQRVDAARSSSWLAGLLRSLVLQGGFGVTQRVVQLREAGGIAAVLTEASQITSSGVKRKYFESLLRSKPALTQAESDRVLRQAAVESSSSGDLRAVVEAAIRGASPSASAVEAAVGRISSDGDRRAVLTHSLRDPNPETVRFVLRVTANIDSDGDKAAVLTQAARYALGSDAARADFYAAAGSIGSDGDRRRVLTTAVRHTPKTAAAVRQFLTSAAAIGSDGDKAAVLLAGIRAGLIVDSATREAFEKTARTIGSDGDLARVTRAMLP